MAKATSLKFERARRDNHNTGVSPLDMLKDVVLRLESGEIKATKAFVTLADEYGTPIISCLADITTAELVTLIEVVKIDALNRRGWL